MPIEARSNSALFRRAEQLKRWEDSETNDVSPIVPKDKKSKIKFSDGCVFLAACAAGDTEEVERLLEKGTDINTTNVDGLTALHQVIPILFLLIVLYYHLFIVFFIKRSNQLVLELTCSLKCNY